MERYLEQTVSGSGAGGKRLLYALAWAAILLFLLLALFFAASIFGNAEGGGLGIDWISAVICLLLIGCAGIVWRAKDRLNIEYDYVFRDGCIEVTAVLNNRRRKTALRLELGRILECGRYDGRLRGKARKLYLNDAGGLTYICYEDKGERRMALLELNDDMVAGLRMGIQRHVWRSEEGKY